MIIKGIDTNNDARPLLLSSTGEVIVSAASLTTTGGKIQVDASGIVQTYQTGNAAFEPVGVHGIFINNSLPAGTSNQDAYTVPAGQRMRVEGIGVSYVGAVATVNLYPYFTVGGVVSYYTSIMTVVSAVYYFNQLGFLLEAGDGFGCRVINATLNNDLYITYFMSRVK